MEVEAARVIYGLNRKVKLFKKNNLHELGKEKCGIDSRVEQVLRQS